VYTADGMKSSIFKPFLIAGSVILTFGFICIWTAQVIQPKEEGEGFAIIGWRFVVGGIVSILIGVISRNFGHITKNFAYIRYRLGRKSKGHKYDELYKP
jgi:fucose permease